MTCRKCKSGKFEEQIADLHAEFKNESFIVRMMALVCSNCGYKTVAGDNMAEYMRRTADEYRSRHELLTSAQIRSRRESLHMSQEQFAAYVGVGVASIKRWELGQVQDRAMDRLVRIVTDPVAAEQNLNRIRALGGRESTAAGEPAVAWSQRGNEEQLEELASMDPSKMQAC